MKTKLYLILYYLCFIITFLVIWYGAFNYVPLFQLGNKIHIIDSLLQYIMNHLFIVSVINIILIIIFTILLIKKKKINVNSLIFPISYLLFLIVIMIICFMFNNKIALEYMHFGYYQRFILIDYVLFNIYSILLFDLERENRNEKKSKKK